MSTPKKHFYWIYFLKRCIAEIKYNVAFFSRRWWFRAIYFTLLRSSSYEISALVVWRLPPPQIRPNTVVFFAEGNHSSCSSHLTARLRDICRVGGVIGGGLAATQSAETPGNGAERRFYTAVNRVTRGACDRALWRRLKASYKNNAVCPLPGNLPLHLCHEDKRLTRLLASFRSAYNSPHYHIQFAPARKKHVNYICYLT